jgi:hypothetical protein
MNILLRIKIYHQQNTTLTYTYIRYGSHSVVFIVKQSTLIQPNTPRI